MKVCSDDHDEIVYDDSAYRAECPLCVAVRKISDLEDKMEEHESTISDLRDEISNLEGDG